MFTRDSEFCGRCNTFLVYPSLAPSKVQCPQCLTKWKFNAINNLQVTSAKTVYMKSIANTEDSTTDTGDAIVEHVCPRCENNEASYTTLQTRSADEGATIFYTCTKCKYKCIEYS
uniref:DNA-directed RNA polymerase subunit n=1 Tax=Strongyloides papillosus TaxID=174720 RepID=A0A0N5B6I6_STREA